MEVPRRFSRRATFDALPGILPQNAMAALEHCRDFAADPADVPAPLLMGKSGSFKTHLIWATAHAMSVRVESEIKEAAAELAANAKRRLEDGDPNAVSQWRVPDRWFPGPDIAVTDGADIAHRIRDTVKTGNLTEVVAKLRQDRAHAADGSVALFVDDVEVMKLSDWLHEELYRVFDWRYQHAMPTMIATNLSGEELRRHLGDRIARRIIDMTEPFEL